MPESASGKVASVRPAGTGLHRFAVLTAFATLGLIFAGGLVTSTESGLSVPDWPTTYGWNMFTFPISKWVGGIRFEHTHRLIASGVGLLTVFLAIALARREPRRWVRRLGYAALAVVVAQGLLGGITVLFFLPTGVSVAHACLAQTFFCLIVTIAVVTSPKWRDRVVAGPRLLFASNPVARAAGAAGAAVFLQLLVGAVMRHTKAGLAIPDFPLAFGRIVPPIHSFPVAIHFAHRVGALVVAGLVAFCAVRAFRSGRPGLKRMAWALCALVLVQIALGGLTVLTRKSVLITTAHVATGALLLGGTLVLGLASMAAQRLAGNVVPIRRAAVAGKAAGWK
jgi:cytochrome c oxidase assembly protein subunit 15